MTEEMFEGKKDILIWKIARLWRDAIEHSKDENYEDVKKLMEKAICIEDQIGFEKVEKKMLVLDFLVALDVENTIRTVQRNWDNKNNNS